METWMPWKVKAHKGRRDLEEARPWMKLQDPSWGTRCVKEAILDPPAQTALTWWGPATNTGRRNRLSYLSPIQPTHAKMSKLSGGGFKPLNSGGGCFIARLLSKCRSYQLKIKGVLQVREDESILGNGRELEIFVRNCGEFAGRIQQEVKLPVSPSGSS